MAITVDTVRTGCSIYEDYKNDSTRNTVETVSNIAGGWGGGFGGAIGGAALGTVIFPGVGTIVGGIIGGLSGGIGGWISMSLVTKKVSDELNYDLIEKTCKTCEIKFKIRKYLGEDCDQENCLTCSEFLNSFRINDENNEVEVKHDKEKIDQINGLYEADYVDKKVKQIDEKEENPNKIK